jgi:uncharacterized protein
MGLKEQIAGDMIAAMKSRDAARTSTLRMLKSAISYREIEKGGALDDDEMAKLLRSQVKQRRDSVEQYQKGGRQDLAAKETVEITVIEGYLPQAASVSDTIEGYLPQAASVSDIEQAVAKAMTETGATSMKEMGAVMKATMVLLAGKNPDGRVVSATVKKKLIDTQEFRQ